LSIMLVASLTTFIVFKSYKNKDNSLAHITYNNELIMSINLDEPTKFKVYDNGETYKGVSKDGSSYLFTYYVYNKDEKAYYNLVVEVIDSKIRIKEETSSKHICSKMGYISNKYESLVCLPNSFVITIENLNNQELDNVM
nr:NusG domain II-containing protein [Gammaproteobacteria bacterium]